MFDKLKVVGGAPVRRFYGRSGDYLLRCRCFLQAEGGVTTVEWVALAAGLVIGSIFVTFIVMRGLTGAANSVVNQLSP